MRNEVSISLYQPEINHFIERNVFLLEQSKYRILEQFKSIELEATDFQESLFENILSHSNPENYDYDESIIYEDSFNSAYNFYDLLSDMKRDIYLNTVALIFHHWDKTLRQWLVKESRFVINVDKLEKNIWKTSFHKIIQFMTLLGWNIKEESFYKDLEAMLFIVNIYKHGNGKSLEDLKIHYPEYFDKNYVDNSHNIFIDHHHLSVNLEQIENFSKTISTFWQHMPKSLQFYDANHIIDLLDTKKRGITPLLK